MFFEGKDPKKKTNALLNISKSEQDSHVEMHAIPYGLSLKSRFECPIYIYTDVYRILLPLVIVLYPC